MRLTWLLPFAAVLGLLLAGWAVLPWAELGAWAVERQRDMQNGMARALRAVRAGDGGAIATLCLATAAYGFVHAMGPGHGKVLLGGAALASGATFRRLTALTLAASAAQAGMAIVLVGALVFGLRLGSEAAVGLTEEWLAPLSYVAIGALGAMLVWRGLRAWAERPRAAGCGCGHAHGPSVAEVRSLGGARDAAALVAGIALRPCTGALLVLVIAARFEVFAVGCLAVLAMGLGTAAFNLMVAGGGVAARRFALVGRGASPEAARRLSGALHVTGGAIVLALSLAMLAPFLV
jgi:ABC-type nickel/cobalt efflux system permease component RcnA